MWSDGNKAFLCQQQYTKHGTNDISLLRNPVPAVRHLQSFPDTGSLMVYSCRWLDRITQCRRHSTIRYLLSWDLWVAIGLDLRSTYICRALVNITDYNNQLVSQNRKFHQAYIVVNIGNYCMASRRNLGESGSVLQTLFYGLKKSNPYMWFHDVTRASCACFAMQCDGHGLTSL